MAHQKQKQYFALFSSAQRKNQSNCSLLYLRILIMHRVYWFGVFCIMAFELFHFDFCWHFSWPLLSLFFTASFGNCLIYCCSNAVKMQPTKRLKTVNLYLCKVKSNLPKAQSSNALHCCNQPANTNINISNNSKKKECPNMANDGETERSDLQFWLTLWFHSVYTLHTHGVFDIRIQTNLTCVL